jgi:hypothetical protein
MRGKDSDFQLMVCGEGGGGEIGGECCVWDVGEGLEECCSW